MNKYQVIQRLLLTEKGASQTDTLNKYFFKVHTKATKLDIKNAVESMFDVKVDKVNTMNRTGKKKRERKVNYGKTANWKRAIVTLHKDSTIDLT